MRDFNKDNKNNGNNFSDKRNFHKRENEQTAPAEGTVAGRNAVLELLKSDRSIDKIFVKEGDREGSIRVIAAEAMTRGIPLVETSKQNLDKMACGIVHQGVVAIAALKEYCEIEDILKIAEERGEPPFVVILDGIEDPYNLGAVIRSAECAGVHGIIIPKRHTAPMTAVVEKASAGALEHMAVAKVANLASAVEKLQKSGVWVYAAEAGGQSYRELDMSGAIGLILGSEGFGVSQLLKERADGIVSIPLRGNISSLNVSAAAAVLLFEASARRN